MKRFLYFLTTVVVALAAAACTLDPLAGGDAAENAAVLKSVLSGEITDARADAALLNAAAAIVAGGKAENIAEGYKIAAESVRSGRAYNKLKEFVSCASGNR